MSTSFRVSARTSWILALTAGAGGFFVLSPAPIAPGRVAVTETRSSPLVIHVAADGDDRRAGWSSTPSAWDGPLASLEAARDHIRRLKTSVGLPPGGVTVRLAEGTYRLPQSFLLNAEDSGTDAAPIRYEAAPNTTVTVSGGRTVNGFSPVTDPTVLARLPEAARSSVLRTDLRAQGFTAADWGVMSIRGFGGPNGLSHAELFYKKQSMNLARWPNAGYVTIAAALDGETGKRFTVSRRPLSAWTGETDLWAHGYWYHDWADLSLPVAGADWSQSLVTLASAPVSYGMRAGQRIRFLNILAELDEPGEWYLDRAGGILYFWPPAPLRNGDVELSVLTELKRLTNVSHVTLSGITYEMSRGKGIVIDGGSGNRIESCVIRGMGNLAVSITGTNSGITHSELSDLAEGGVRLFGGNRTTLTAGGLYADHNHIHHFSRWCRTYRGAIDLSGVGNRASHNHIHDAPHTAIFHQGNDQFIEYNDIHHVLDDTGDAGAVYTGRDWTARGTRIRYNFFHDMKGPGNNDISAVYLDDQASGVIVEGNIFHRVGRAILIGGGVDNRFVSNLIVDSSLGVHLDARGLSWQKDATLDPNGTLQTRLRAVPTTTPPWSTRYPTLPGLLSDDPGTPKRNVIRSNVSYRTTWAAWHLDATLLPLQNIADNSTGADPLFVFNSRLGTGNAPRATDFLLKADSPAYALGFVLPPLDQIGPLETDGTVKPAPPRRLDHKP